MKEVGSVLGLGFGLGLSCLGIRFQTHICLLSSWNLLAVWYDLEWTFTHYLNPLIICSSVFGKEDTRMKQMSAVVMVIELPCLGFRFQTPHVYYLAGKNPIWHKRCCCLFNAYITLKCTWIMNASFQPLTGIVPYFTT